MNASPAGPDETGAARSSRPLRHVVVMGVSGSGKTSVARDLAAVTGWEFLEGDDLHPPDNVARMAAGTPLTDEDRWPWLRAIGAWITAREEDGADAVITCSSLRRAYRDVLRERRPHVELLHLDVPAEELRRRLEQRSGHYMKASMLDSQLAALEPLQPDEPGVTVTTRRDEPATVRACIEALGLDPAAPGVPAAPSRGPGQRGSA